MTTEAGKTPPVTTDAPPLVTVDDIRQARQRITSAIRPTPVEPSEPLSGLCGRPIAVKPEYRQRTGSFKIRGATNFVSRLAPGTEVVAASAGNHGQGVALAASQANLGATVFMPRTAPVPKVQATRGYGARVELVGDTVDDAIAAARAYATEHAAVFVPPFDDPLVIAGQGTIGLEVVEEAPEAEVVVVPVGGGGLISGIAAALAEAHPRPRVVGVQAAGAACVQESLRAGRCVRLGSVATMADGIAIKGPSPLTLAHVEALVDDVVTVEEEDISRSVVLLLERAKAVVEPAGAVSLAAILAGKVPGSGLAIAVLSGGNVDPLLLVKLISHGLSAAGRYLVLRIVLDDHPGALARLTAAVADKGLNVISVEHHRSGLASLAMDQVEVMLTLETRDPDHRDEVVDDLRTSGYRVELIG